MKNFDLLTINLESHFLKEHSLAETISPIVESYLTSITEFTKTQATETKERILIISNNFCINNPQNTSCLGLNDFL